MNPRPAWLPPVVSVNGSPEEIFARLYRVFEADFKQTKRTFEGQPVNWDKRVLEGKYEEGFWHLITKDDREANARLLDPRRAERLPWCGPTISHAQEGVVKAWANRESKRNFRVYIWLENLDYVAILEKRLQKDKFRLQLITAYYVEGEATRKKLRAKYANRES